MHHRFEKLYLKDALKLIPKPIPDFSILGFETKIEESFISYNTPLNLFGCYYSIKYTFQRIWPVI